jgi:hypothetical protein
MIIILPRNVTIPATIATTFNNLTHITLKRQHEKLMWPGDVAKRLFFVARVTISFYDLGGMVCYVPRVSNVPARVG